MFAYAGKEPSAMRVSVLNWLTRVCLDLLGFSWIILVQLGLLLLVKLSLIYLGFILGGNVCPAGKEPSATRVNVLNWLTRMCLDLLGFTWIIIV